jgi:hypothetical protein
LGGELFQLVDVVGGGDPFLELGLLGGELVDLGQRRRFAVPFFAELVGLVPQLVAHETRRQEQDGEDPEKFRDDLGLGRFLPVLLEFFDPALQVADSRLFVTHGVATAPSVRPATRRPRV